MALDPTQLATNAAKATGATAGLGVGGGLSYGFFQVANGGELIARGDLYGLTAFAVIALILLISALIVLPPTANDLLRKTIVGTLVFFAVLAGWGFYKQTQTPPSITVNASFAPDLDDINARYKLPKQYSLEADVYVDGHQEERKVFSYGKRVSLIAKSGSEINVLLNRLPETLQEAIDSKIAKVTCDNCSLDHPIAVSDEVGKTR